MRPEEAGALADLVKERRIHNDNMATYRIATNEPVERLTPLAVRMARLSEENSRACVALNLADTLTHPVCVIDNRGEPLTEGTRDIETLIDWWSGEYAHRWPGVPTGPSSGLFGLALTPEKGWAWLRKIATVKTPGRMEVLQKLTDRATQLGVPGPLDDWDRVPEHTLEHVRDHDGEPMFVGEVVDPQQLAALAVQHSRGEREYRQMMMTNWKLAHVQTRREEWLVWKWRKGLPVGSRPLADGVRCVACLPARDSVLDFDTGLLWQVRTWPGNSPWLRDVPDWLFKVLSEL